MQKMRPRNAKNKFQTQFTLFESLDALVVSAFGFPPVKSASNHGGIETPLTSKPRVFVLLYGKGIRLDEAELNQKPINITRLRNDEWKTTEARVVRVSPRC